MNKFWNIFGIICSIIFICFLGLALFKVVEWPWWLICMPVFIYVGFIVLMLVVSFVLALILPDSFFEEVNIEDDEK